MGALSSIPLIISGPGFENGGRIDELTSLIDLPPTLMQISISYIVVAMTLCLPSFSHAANIKTEAELTGIENVPRENVVCFAIYTLHNNTLKITGQLFPLEEGEP